MELTIKGKPGEIAALLGSMKGIISNDTLDAPLNASESTGIKHFVDTEAINELVQLAHTKRREETRSPKKEEENFKNPLDKEFTV